MQAVVDSTVISTTSSRHALYVLGCFSHVQLFATPWVIVHQTLLSMGFSRPEYWSG